jgi:hypothetical protein
MVMEEENMMQGVTKKANDFGRRGGVRFLEMKGDVICVLIL